MSTEQYLSMKMEDFEKLSTEKILEIIQLLELEAQQDHVQQMALKILINSLYGALANQHFLLANPDMAAAVTSSGRFFVQLLANRLEEKLQALLPWDEKYVIAGDTDSVVGESIIEVNGERVAIEDFFNSVSSPVTITPSGNEVKPVNDISTPTVTDGKQLIQSQINYVMRHKVKKRMYRITVGDKSVDVTEDHAIIVERNGVLCDVKPAQIIDGDVIVTKVEHNIEFHDNFEVEDLGVIEHYVYDIEVEDTHRFFANDILVHNSVYLTLKPIVNHKFKDTDTPTMDIVDWVDNFEKKFLKKIIDEVIEEYGDILNIYDTEQVGVEREIISDRAFFVAKKRYAARVLDSEGVRFELDDPKIKVMGLEIARSSTPPWVKDKLTESISIILDNDEYGVRKWRDETKLQYTSQDIESISATQGISSLDYNINDKGIPQGSRSALAHNLWVKQNGLEDEIELLQPGEKYKRCYLKTPNRFNTDILSFQSPKIIKIIEEDGIFDYSTNFQKQFEQPLERMIEGMGYNIEDKPHFGNLDDW